MSRLTTALFVFLIFASALKAQTDKTPKPADYTPTEVQSLRLQLAQVKAKDALAAYQVAQQNYQQALAALSAEGERTKKENGWPSTLQLNYNDLTFTEPPPTPAPVPPTQPPASTAPIQNPPSK